MVICVWWVLWLFSPLNLPSFQAEVEFSLGVYFCLLGGWKSYFSEEPFLSSPSLGPEMTSQMVTSLHLYCSSQRQWATQPYHFMLLSQTRGMIWLMLILQMQFCLHHCAVTCLLRSASGGCLLGCFLPVFQMSLCPCPPPEKTPLGAAISILLLSLFLCSHTTYWESGIPWTEADVGDTVWQVLYGN